MNVQHIGTMRALLEASEGQVIDGWRDVYLDNAKASEHCSDMTPTRFRSHLSQLAKDGLYRPVDNYAWGQVKVHYTEPK